MNCKNCGGPWDGTKCDYCGTGMTFVLRAPSFEPWGDQMKVKDILAEARRSLEQNEYGRILAAKQAEFQRQNLVEAARYGVFGTLGAVAGSLFGGR